MILCIGQRFIVNKGISVLLPIAKWHLPIRQGELSSETERTTISFCALHRLKSRPHACNVQCRWRSKLLQRDQFPNALGGKGESSAAFPRVNGVAQELGSLISLKHSPIFTTRPFYLALKVCADTKRHYDYKHYSYYTGCFIFGGTNGRTLIIYERNSQKL